MLPTEGSGAAGSKFKVQGSNALKRVQGSKLHTEGSGAAGSKFKVQGSKLPPSPPGGELSYLSSRQANYAL